MLESVVCTIKQVGLDENIEAAYTTQMYKIGKTL